MLRKLLDNRFTRPIRPAIDRFCARHAFLCKEYERLSNSRSTGIRNALFEQSASSLYHPDAQCALSTWRVDDGTARFSLPIRPGSVGFDWNNALTALGHDIELKSIYRRVATWSRATSENYLFVDCGANFGLHSAYHLSIGVQTHSFEPNPNCGTYFRMLAGLNGWHADHWHATALGSASGEVCLNFPEGEEWLGTIQQSVHFQPGRKITHLQVPIRTLDQHAFPTRPCLVKIDVEGSEVDVLRGARQLLHTQIEAVLFESWRNSPDRPALFDLFDQAGFDVAGIDLDGRTRLLNHAQFLAEPATNALALRRNTGATSMSAFLRG